MSSSFGEDVARIDAACIDWGRESNSSWFPWSIDDWRKSRVEDVLDTPVDSSVFALNLITMTSFSVQNLPELTLSLMIQVLIGNGVSGVRSRLLAICILVQPLTNRSCTVRLPWANVLLFLIGIRRTWREVKTIWITTTVCSVAAHWALVNNVTLVRLARLLPIQWVGPEIAIRSTCKWNLTLRIVACGSYSVIGLKDFLPLAQHLGCCTPGIRAEAASVAVVCLDGLVNCTIMAQSLFYTLTSFVTTPYSCYPVQSQLLSAWTLELYSF